MKVLVGPLVTHTQILQRSQCLARPTVNRPLVGPGLIDSRVAVILAVPAGTLGKKQDHHH